MPSTTSDTHALVAGHPLWYHTMELAPGLVTPGWFDLRPIVDVLPWPDVEGKRCLDVGPYDGFLSFELERRGAREVLAADIGNVHEWDWPHDMRARSGDLGTITGFERTGRGFEIAKEVLGSRVERVEISAYDLSPERLGEFDVVVCGTLLLHLQDPMRALQAIRSVCAGTFLSAEQIETGLSLIHRRTPVFRLNGIGELCQWWLPNAAGHRQMLAAAGFRVERTSRPYAIPLGPAHAAPPRTIAKQAKRIATRVLTRGAGVPHCAALTTPAD